MEAHRRRPGPRSLVAAAALVAVLAAVAVIGGAADDRDPATEAVDDASAATAVAMEEAARIVADADEVAGAEAPTGAAAAPGDDGAVAPAQAAPGDSTLAITALASLRVDDVRRTVDLVSATVEGVGGRTAAARVEYDDRVGDGEIDESYAVLTLLIPPDQLPGVVDRLGDFGEVVTYEQQAEDVGEQLADLDTRIDNARASVERARELLAEAETIADLVLVEGELTARETELELLLASKQQLDDRVAMSTLTLDIGATVTPVLAVRASHEIEVSAVAVALSDGWAAFAGAAVAVVVGLATALPFLVAAGLAAMTWLAVSRRRRPLRAAVEPGTRPG